MQNYYTSEDHMLMVRVIRKLYCYQSEEEVGQTIDQFWIEHYKLLSRAGSFATSYICKCCYKIWKIISVTQSVYKAIHQGPGNGWLPSDIKNTWHRKF